MEPIQIAATNPTILIFANSASHVRAAHVLLRQRAAFRAIAYERTTLAAHPVAEVA